VGRRRAIRGMWRLRPEGPRHAMPGEPSCARTLARTVPIRSTAQSGAGGAIARGGRRAGDQEGDRCRRIPDATPRRAAGNGSGPCDGCSRRGGRGRRRRSRSRKLMLCSPAWSHEDAAHRHRPVLATRVGAGVLGTPPVTRFARARPDPRGKERLRRRQRRRRASKRGERGPDDGDRGRASGYVRSARRRPRSGSALVRTGRRARAGSRAGRGRWR
jgi:hypothetical protein